MFLKPTEWIRPKSTLLVQTHTIAQMLVTSLVKYVRIWWIFRWWTDRSKSINQSSISQDPARSHQSGSTSYNYPQQLHYEVDPGYVPTKSPVLQQYKDVPRAWTSSNSQVHLVTHATGLNYDHNTHSEQTYETYSDHFAAMYAEKRRPTQSKLEVHNYMTSPMSSMTRWEQQGYRTGPWDGVGSVRNDKGEDENIQQKPINTNSWGKFILYTCHTKYSTQRRLKVDEGVIGKARSCHAYGRSYQSAGTSITCVLMIWSISQGLGWCFSMVV